MVERGDDCEQVVVLDEDDSLDYIEMVEDVEELNEITNDTEQVRTQMDFSVVPSIKAFRAKASPAPIK